MDTRMGRKISAMLLALLLALPMLLWLAPKAAAEGDVIDFISITGFKPVGAGLPVTGAEDISLNDSRLRISDMYCYVTNSSPTIIHDTFVAGTEYTYRIEIEVVDSADCFVFGMNSDNIENDGGMTAHVVNYGSTDVKKILVYGDVDCELESVHDMEAYGITAPVIGLRLPGKESFIANGGVIIDSVQWSVNGRTVSSGTAAAAGNYRLFLTLGSAGGYTMKTQDLENRNFTVSFPGTSASVAMVNPNIWYEERLSTVSIEFVPMASVTPGWTHVTSEDAAAYAAPGTSSVIRATLPAGTAVQVTDTQNGWACIGVNGYIAWVPADKLDSLPSVPSVRAAVGASGIDLTLTPISGSSSFRILRRVVGGTYSVLEETDGITYTDTSAAAGNLYEYAVQALDAQGDPIGTQSDAARCLRLGKSTVNLQSRVGGVNVTWTPVTGADSYEVLRLVDGEYISCGIYTTTETTVYGMTEGEEVTISLRPRRTAGGTVWYGLKSADYHLTLHQPVPELTAENVARGVKLTWKQVTGANQYRIYRSVNGSDFAYLSSSTSTTLNDSNARTNGAVYRYKITAGVSTDGTTVYSPESNIATTVFLTAPTLNGSNRLGGIQLTWKAIDGAESYVLARGGTRIAEVSSTNYLDTYAATVYNNEQLKYTAYTKLTYEGVEYSSAASSTLTVTRTTQKPVLTAERVDGAILLSWTAVEDADKYNIQMNRLGDRWTDLGFANGLSMEVSGDLLASGDTPEFRICAAMTDAETHATILTGAFSDSLRYAWLDTPAPQATVSENKVTLSWAVIPGAYQYEVWASINGNDPRLQSTLYANSFTMNVEPGSRYDYTVRAKQTVDGVQCFSEFSDGVTVQTSVRMSDISAAIRGNGIYLSWDPLGSAERMQVSRSLNTGYAVIHDMDLTDSSGWLDTDLQVGDVVTYQVRAITLDSFGIPVAGEWSESVRVAYLPAPTVTFGCETLGARITWTPVNGAAGYQIHRRVGNNGYEPVADVTGTAWLDTEVDEGDMVAYTVTPYTVFKNNRLNGEAGYLNGMQTVTVPKPTLTAALAADGTHLSWSAVPGAEAYRVERRLNGGNFACIAEVSGRSLITVTAADGTIADYRVAAVQQSVTGRYSNTGRVVAVTPASLSAAERVGEVRLTWTVPAGATGVKIKRMAGNREEDLTSATANGAFSDTEHGIFDTGTVTYRIYAYVSADGVDHLSPAADVTCAVSNPRPEINIWSTQNGILLNWTDVPYAERYVIRRGANASLLEDCAIVEGNEWTDTVSPDDWVFDVAPMAAGAAGQTLRGRASLVASAHRLSRVEGLSAAMHPVGVKLSWRSVYGAEDYMIYRTVNGTEAAAAAVTATSWIDTEVPDGTPVTYTVRGRKMEQGVMVDGLISAPLAVTPARTAPANLILDDTNPYYYDIRWTAMKEASAYRVYRSVNGGAYELLETTPYSSCDTPRVAGEYWKIRVSAVCTVGGVELESPCSGEIAYMRLESTAVSAESVFGGLALTWNDVTGASAYRVYTVNNGTRTLFTETAETGCFYPAAHNARAAFDVVAVHTEGHTEYTSPAGTGTSFTAKSPTVRLSGEADGLLMQLSWTEAEGVRRYEVYRDSQSHGFVRIAMVDTPFYTDVSASGASHTYKILPVGTAPTGEVNGRFSNEITLQGLSEPVITARSMPFGTELTWCPVEGAVGYRVERITTGGTQTLMTGTATAYLDRSAVIGVPTTYKVTAIGSLNGTETAASVTATRATNTILLTAFEEEQTVRLSWTPVAGAESYRVYLHSAAGKALRTETQDCEAVLTIPQGTAYTVDVCATATLNGSLTESVSSNAAEIGWFAETAVGAECTLEGLKLTVSGTEGADRWLVTRTVNGEETTFAFTGNTCLDTDVASNDTLVYTLKPVSGQGAYTLEGRPVQITVTYRTETPELTAVLDGTNIRVSWTAVSGADGYQLQKRVQNGDWTPVGYFFSGSTEYTEPAALRPGQVQEFRVRALTYAWFENTTFSNTDKTVGLVAPIVVVTENRAGGMHVTWTISTGAQRYRVERSLNGDAWVPLDLVTNASYTDTEAIPMGSEVRYRVFALYQVDGETVVSTACISDTAVMAAFTVTPVAVQTEDGIELTWQAIAGANMYRVEACYDNINVVTLAETAGTSVPDLNRSAKHLYRVIAMGETADGTPVTGLTGPWITFIPEARPAEDDGEEEPPVVLPDPAVPEVVLSEDGTTVILTWDEDENADRYAIYRSLNGEAETLMAVTEANTWSTVPGTGVHTFRVKALRGEGSALVESGWSEAVEAALIPSADVTVVNSAAGILVTWPEANGVYAYQIWRSVNGGAYEKLKSVVGLKWDDADVSDGSVYAYKVRTYIKMADGGLAYSEYGAESSVISLRTTTVKLTNAATGITVKWSAVTGAHAYQIWRSRDGGTFEKVKSTTGVSWTDTSVVNGSEYTYKVRAYETNAAGGIDYAEYSTEVTLMALHMESVDIANEANGVQLAWDEVDGAKAYQIFKADDNGTYTRVKTVTTESWLDTDVESGEEYAYKIRAYASTDDGIDYSAYFTELNILFVAPPEVTASKNSSGAVVRWDAVDGASAYQVWRKEANGEMVKVKSLTGRSYTDTTVRTGVTYTYYVRAYFNDGSSLTYSAFASASI